MRTIIQICHTRAPCVRETHIIVNFQQDTNMYVYIILVNRLIHASADQQLTRLNHKMCTESGRISPPQIWHTRAPCVREMHVITDFHQDNMSQ